MKKVIAITTRPGKNHTPYTCPEDGSKAFTFTYYTGDLTPAEATQMITAMRGEGGIIGGWWEDAEETGQATAPVSLADAQITAMERAIATDATVYVVAVADGFAVMTGAEVMAAGAGDAVHGYADAGSPGIFGSPARYVTRAELVGECADRLAGYTMRMAA